MSTNEQILAAVEEGNAVATVLSQARPAHLFDGYAQKTSFKGVSCDFIVNKAPIVAADLDEATLKFIEQVGLAALKADAVGTWKVKLTQIA